MQLKQQCCSVVEGDKQTVVLFRHSKTLKHCAAFTTVILTMQYCSQKLGGDAVKVNAC
jgi:hypothetical protein